MFAASVDTTPSAGRPELHPAWREPMPDRLYAPRRLGELVLLRDCWGDEAAGREIERREQFRRMLDAEAGRPRWETARPEKQRRVA